MPAKRITHSHYHKHRDAALGERQTRWGDLKEASGHGHWHAHVEAQTRDHEHEHGELDQWPHPEAQVVRLPR